MTHVSACTVAPESEAFFTSRYAMKDVTSAPKAIQSLTSVATRFPPLALADNQTILIRGSGSHVLLDNVLLKSKPLQVVSLTVSSYSKV